MADRSPSNGSVDGSGSVPVGSAADLGHEPGQLAAARPEERRQRTRVDVAEERPERFDERPVRKPAGPEREAPADEDAGTRSRHLIRERGDQPGLADPGLARDDDDPRFAGRRPRVGPGEAPELCLPPDEALAASTIHDAAMIGAPKGTPSRPAIDQLEAEAHAVMPASSNRRPEAAARTAQAGSGGLAGAADDPGDLLRAVALRGEDDDLPVGAGERGDGIAQQVVPLVGDRPRPRARPRHRGRAVRASLASRRSSAARG